MSENSVPQKTCSKCGFTFDATAHNFPANKRGLYGLHSQCKKCRNRAVCERAKLDPIAHRDRAREYRKQHPDKSRAASRKWKQLNYDRSRERVRLWWQHNPEKMRMYVQRREARKKTLPNNFTNQDWQMCLEYFNHSCAVCGRPAGLWHTLAQDHWVALSKDGGYVPTNIVPLCHGEGGCNNSKQNKDAETWLTERYGKRKAKEIMMRIQAYFDSLRDGAE